MPWSKCVLVAFLLTLLGGCDESPSAVEDAGGGGDGGVLDAGTAPDGGELVDDADGAIVDGGPIADGGELLDGSAAEECERRCADFMAVGCLQASPSCAASCAATGEQASAASCLAERDAWFGCGAREREACDVCMADQVAYGACVSAAGTDPCVTWCEATYADGCGIGEGSSDVVCPFLCAGQDASVRDVGCSAEWGAVVACASAGDACSYESRCAAELSAVEACGSGG